MSSTCTKLPGRTRPSGPSTCCQAILAKRVPSGQGEMLPDCAAFTATSLPRMKRKVLLSPRSVVLMGFHVLKVGSKASPFSSGCTDEREMGGSVGTAAAAFVSAGGGGVAHGARYVFR